MRKMSLRRKPALLLLLSAAIASCSSPQAASIAREVERLNADDPATRALASRTLLEWGEEEPTGDEVRDALRKCAQPRAQELLRHLEFRGRVPPGLLLVEGLTEQLLVGTGFQAWKWAKQREVKLAPEDWTFLVEEAFRRPDLEFPVLGSQELLGFVAEQRLQGCLPRAKELFEDPDPRVRLNAAVALIALHAGDFAPRIAALLRDPDQGVSSMIEYALRHYASKEFAPAVAEMIHDPDDRVFWNSTYLLRDLGSMEVAPEVAKLLKHPESNRRDQALMLLGSLKAKAFAPAVADLLRDPDDRVRKVAVRTLGELEAKEFAPRVAELLQEADLRREALRSYFKTRFLRAASRLAQMSAAASSWRAWKCSGVRS